MGGLRHSITCTQLQHTPDVLVCKHPCELCHEKARVFCAADEAELCFECDSKVHSANFLVRKHSRDVLCCSCGALTPLALTGPWIECRPQHCARCPREVGRCGSDDEDVVLSPPTLLSSLESCCTEDDGEERIWQQAAVPQLKRPAAVIAMEEGCGDSDDHRPCPSKRKRRRGRSHAPPARRRGAEPLPAV